jgi:thiamine pyrophosphokinase
MQRKRCALVISGSPGGVAPELVALLALDAEFIVAVDSGADVAQQAGLTPDLLLGDFDSIDARTFARLHSEGVETLAYDAHKDATDLELALKVLLQRGFTALLVTHALGGRIDHELAALGNLTAVVERGMTVIIIEENEVCVLLSACGEQGKGSVCGMDNGEDVCATDETVGTCAVLKLDFSSVLAPSFVSFIPWGSKAEVSIQGVEWELDHALLAPSSSRGVSNVVVADQVNFTVHKGTAIVVLST